MGPDIFHPCPCNTSSCEEIKHHLRRSVLQTVSSFEVGNPESGPELQNLEYRKLPTREIGNRPFNLRIYAYINKSFGLVFAGVTRVAAATPPPRPLCAEVRVGGCARAWYKRRQSGGQQRGEGTKLEQTRKAPTGAGAL